MLYCPSSLTTGAWRPHFCLNDTFILSAKCVTCCILQTVLTRCYNHLIGEISASLTTHNKTISVCTFPLTQLHPLTKIAVWK